MDRANNLPKIQDEERESMFGYVYGVSGPGNFNYYSIFYNMLLKPKKYI